MRVLYIGSNILDLDEVSSTTVHAGFLQLLFKNGENLSLAWRDDDEKKYILGCFPSVEVAA